MNSPNRKNKLFAFLLLNIAFVILFYPQGLGLNVLLYAILFLSAFRFLNRDRAYGWPDYLVQGSFLLTSLMLVVHHNMWSMVVFGLLGLTVVGQSLAYSIPSVIHSNLLGWHALFFSYGKMFESWSGFQLGRFSLRGLVKVFRIIFIPSFIILLFMGLYSFASPGFHSFLGKFEFILENIAKVMERIDARVLGLTIAAVFIHTAFVYFKSSEWLSNQGKKGRDLLTRNRTNRITNRHKTLDLLVEYRAGIYLLVVLNAFLLIVNYFDVKDVWLEFNWEGQYLKNYVHQGTRVLIFSIIVSIVVVMYYFRGNLNFYKKNKRLKVLATVWLVQNALLTISVGVRVAQYVMHYNLAYRRIALFVFLLLVLFAIMSVIQKIHKTKSTFYLLRVNGLAWLIVLTASTMVNWNGVVARYNLAHYKTAFVHLDFLASMPDATLNDLRLTPEQSESLKKHRIMPSDMSHRYMSVEAFDDRIDYRVSKFLREYDKKSFLAWNLAEYRTAKRLRVN